MKSVLLCVGCDHYDFLDRLYGAENDARRVHSSLTANGQHYNASDGVLLRSPSKAQFETALRSFLPGTVDVLTFYFAGHGEAREGSYYFCLRDTVAEFMSVTAYALNSWLNVVKEVRPRFSYLIIDSCFSGGSHQDIRDLLNDPRIGKSSASTFACLAAASSDQYANEVGGEGVMTTELVKVFDGRLRVGCDQQYLDLTEVGRVIGERFREQKAEQRPIAWGLNLFGSGRLCRNPHFALTGGSFHIPDVPVDSALAARVSACSEALWDLYRSAADRGVDPDELRSVVNHAAGGSEVGAKDRGVFVYGLAQALVQRVDRESWEQAEVMGCCAALLLEDIGADATCEAAARQLLNQKTRLELTLIASTSARLAADPLALLNRPHFMADYCYLPLRIVKLLASVANAVVTARDLGIPCDSEAARAFVRVVIDRYMLGLKAVTDEQAPYVYVWSKHARQLAWTDELETVAGGIFADYVAAGGMVARYGLEPLQLAEYCLARGSDLEAVKPGWIANPGQLLPVLLLVLSESGLDETADPYLERIDHVRMNLFFPADYRKFAHEIISDGVNHTYEIGHDVWTCSDYVRHFREDWSKYIASARFPGTSLERHIAIAAALAYPDRVPLALESVPLERL